MPRDTNFEDEAIGQRLGDFLDPAFGEGWIQLLNNRTNFCRRERHYLYARPTTQRSLGCPILYALPVSVRLRVTVADCTHFCPMGPIRTQTQASGALLEHVAILR
ncbi:hypothetical protein NSPZN2_160020 [Nitrospira defluvii]|uniref:Uncharacterized protein n=1 Tax=Nitrospira defluvii TaxID=330214 RepID=A0ABM8RBF2_9BACT|nr:hypothetical protein NSPZN2_160020 [Nitrospira defluvii]